MANFDYVPRRRLLMGCALLLLLSACGGGGSSDAPVGASPLPADCDGHCVESQAQGDPDRVRLTTGDVERIIAQAVAEAGARNSQATLAVVDRVGNVLAVWRMGTAPQTVLIASQPDGQGGSEISGGLEGIEAGIDALAAIAKAVTGAYLSSEGNAFSTRTASQIVQSHFNPGERFQPAGPLFGVQFSQLACSDFTRAFNNTAPDWGPKRSPLGLSADPGGFPLYKNGTLVGGVGVISDGLYSLDANVLDEDAVNDDEAIATAASFGFAAPAERRADRITVEGKTFRFADPTAEALLGNPQDAVYPPADGQLLAVPGYSAAVISEGLIFGRAESGVRAADPARPDEAAFADDDGFVFVDGLGNNRFPPSDAAAPAGAGLSAEEVEVLLEQALQVANRARAQIRQPLGSQARVSISVVDSDGNILGMLRSRDAPVFGADVALQKSRTAAFFSSAEAAATLGAVPPARYINLAGATINTVDTAEIADYVDAARDFLNIPSALADGAIAFSDRAGGNLSRPHFPDGIDDAPPGPFSKPAGEWSPFSTGLQLDLVLNGIIQHVLFAAGAIPTDVSIGCGGIGHDAFGNFSASGFAHQRLANGIQIFPGSVPIYRGEQLVGGIGISGDGVEQDDMIAFLAVDQAAAILDGDINNAPPHMRADTLRPKGTRLRFIQCPQAPFLDSDEQQPCAGK